jgi:hypothetical protein
LHASSNYLGISLFLDGFRPREVRRFSRGDQDCSGPWALGPERLRVRMVGFEPTFSSTPSWRIASLSYILIQRLQSAQWELNPRVPHGKRVGFRYIMGAFNFAELSKTTGRQ